MWPSLIGVHDRGLEETVELFLLQDQEMIQAFSPDASQKAFTDGIGSWRPVRCSKHFDPTWHAFSPKTKPSPCSSYRCLVVTNWLEKGL